MESTKDKIEDKIRTYKDIPEVVNTEHSDASPSPNSKLVKRHMEKMHRERTLEGVGNNQVRKEMDRYERFSLPGKKFNILSWWKQHEAVLPLLASLAKNILCIPASSDQSERVFSTGGNIVTAKRKRLVPKNVESLIVIKENMAMVEVF